MNTKNSDMWQLEIDQLYQQRTRWQLEIEQLKRQLMYVSIVLVGSLFLCLLLSIELVSSTNDPRVHVCGPITTTDIYYGKEYEKVAEEVSKQGCTMIFNSTDGKTMAVYGVAYKWAKL